MEASKLVLSILFCIHKSQNVVVKNFTYSARPSSQLCCEDCSGFKLTPFILLKYPEHCCVWKISKAGLNSARLSISSLANFSPGVAQNLHFDYLANFFKLSRSVCKFKRCFFCQQWCMQCFDLGITINNCEAVRDFENLCDALVNLSWPNVQSFVKCRKPLNLIVYFFGETRKHSVGQEKG